MRVFNVPPSARFLHTVIEALVDGKLVEGFSARTNPEFLADVTLYLPTRRAGRLARQTFLDVLKIDALLLPRIVALGSADEDELEFAHAEADMSALDIPPALDGLPRRLTLARLVAAWAAQLKPQDSITAPLVANGPAAILALADDLARLIDDMVIRKVEWSAFDHVVPDDLDDYWKLTFDFLKIAKEHWPEHLRDNDLIEPKARQERLLAAEMARLKTFQKGPVIAAGSTGSIPSTAAFLRAVANLPQGAVVLPGLDTHLEDSAWQSIGGAQNADGKETSPAWSHPQFALHHLLTDVFGMARRDVVTLGAPSAHGRETLASEAMRPSGSSAVWHTQLEKPEIAKQIATGMTNLAVVEAANPEMEALAIAVAMREARSMGKQAALVTPDRALARRVIAALGRWNLDVDDSGGDSLMDTTAGLFARLIAKVASEQFAPPTLLALFKHPLFRLGEAKGKYDTAIADLELALLRGTRPPPGSEGLSREFAIFRGELAKFNRKESSSIHRSELRATLNDALLDAVGNLIVRLAAAFKPLEDLKASQPFDFAEIAARHRDVIAALSRDDEKTIHAFESFDGRALASCFDELLQSSSEDIHPTGLATSLGDYHDVFQTAFAGKIVRRPPSPDAQLRIYGLLEARLTESTRVILGGLVEGIWPPQPSIDPWLSRPIRHQLGLDLPERRIGLTAHDFTQLLGAEDVILTHASKMGGAPAVASRFLHRLKAVADDESWEKAKQRGDDYIRFASELDKPYGITPAKQPAPKPPRVLRPLKLSATEIEDLFRDPYTIYAKHILKLLPLDPVDMALTAADRGSAIHEALGEFTAVHATSLPDDILAELRRYGEKHFAPLMERPEARALWWPRFLRIAAWFAGWEQQRRVDVTNIDAEIYGILEIPLGDNRIFKLSARADRVEHHADGSFAIVDYKTGQAPTGKMVRIGVSPQLSLEAAILRAGGFKDIPAASSVGEFMYVRLSGNNPPGKAEPLVLAVERDRSDEITPDQAAIEARDELEKRLRKFEDETQGYPSLDLPMWKNRYGSYDDLARIKEWSAVGGNGGGE